MELLELLKSIHSKGGVFEKSLNQVPLKGDLTEGVLSELFDEFVVDGTTYKIPSPQYVEERIVETTNNDYDLCIRKRKHIEEWQYGIWDGLYINNFNDEDKGRVICHPDRLIASLMLWDKLLTKDEVKDVK